MKTIVNHSIVNSFPCLMRCTCEHSSEGINEGDIYLVSEVIDPDREKIKYAACLIAAIEAEECHLGNIVFLNELDSKYWSFLPEGFSVNLIN